MSDQQPNQQQLDNLENLELFFQLMMNEREREAELTLLLISLFEKSPDKLAEEDLSSFNIGDWMELLKFCHSFSSHHPSFDFTEQHWNCFDNIMMACPSGVLTEYLSSLPIRCQIDIVRRSYVIWTKYFLCLIRRVDLIEIDCILFRIGESLDENFQFNLVLNLVREISNHDLDHDLRESIFMFICSHRSLVSRVVEHIYGRQRNFIQHLANIYRWITEVSGRNMFHYVPWQPQAQAHRAVNAEAFIEGYFPSLHPLCNDREYKCGICLSNHDEPNDDHTTRIFREFPCCHQHACHECLVGCVKTCNTFDPQSSINPDEFSCPCCRAKKSFFS